MVTRKYTFKLYPNAEQEKRLIEMKRVHCDIYNAALEERIDAYNKKALSISFPAQCRSLTIIRQTDERVAAVNCHSVQATLRRLDRAYKAFFRRIKDGEEPGFPRFKSSSRFPGWTYTQHGDGFRFYAGEKQHGRLYLSGIGTLRARGRMRLTGEIKCADILHRYGQWFLSLSIEVDAINRIGVGTGAFAFDWGVNTLLACVDSDGNESDIENPRWYKNGEERQTQLDRAVSRKREYSKRWRRASRAAGKLKSKQARRRADHHHKLSAQIARQYAAVCGEELHIKPMTRSSKGTIEKPGKRVKQKAGLNREILDTAPAALYQQLSYKVTETGGWFVKSPTQQLKPSQRCPGCWRVKKKTLSEREHHCPHCGLKGQRDRMSAKVNLIWLTNELNRAGTVLTVNPVRNHEPFPLAG